MTTLSLNLDLENYCRPELAFAMSTRKVLEPCRLADFHRVVRGHVVQGQHIRGVWRYELEEKLGVLVRSYGRRLVECHSATLGLRSPHAWPFASS